MKSKRTDENKQSVTQNKQNEHCENIPYDYNSFLKSGYSSAYLENNSVLSKKKFKVNIYS